MALKANGVISGNAFRINLFLPAINQLQTTHCYTGKLQHFSTQAGSSEKQLGYPFKVSMAWHDLPRTFFTATNQSNMRNLQLSIAD